MDDPKPSKPSSQITAMGGLLYKKKWPSFRSRPEPGHHEGEIR
jgi:hypothetical protein